MTAAIILVTKGLNEEKMCRKIRNVKFTTFLCSKEKGIVVVIFAIIIVRSEQPPSCPSFLPSSLRRTAADKNNVNDLFLGRGGCVGGKVSSSWRRGTRRRRGQQVENEQNKHTIHVEQMHEPNAIEERTEKEDNWVRENTKYTVRVHNLLGVQEEAYKDSIIVIVIVIGMARRRRDGGGGRGEQKIGEEMRERVVRSNSSSRSYGLLSRLNKHATNIDDILFTYYIRSIY